MVSPIPATERWHGMFFYLLYFLVSHERKKDALQTDVPGELKQFCQSETKSYAPEIRDPEEQFQNCATIVKL